MLPKHPISQKKSLSVFISLCITILLLAGCILPSSVASTTVPPTATQLLLNPQAASPTANAPLATATLIPPSPTVSVPLPTATLIPPSPTFIILPTATETLIPPSPTPEPTATSETAGNQIIFTRGSTAAVVSGSVRHGQVVEYTIDASETQPMILRLDSTVGDVYLGVLDPNGDVMLAPTKKWTYWQWRLPFTGKYTIQIYGGAGFEDYQMTVKVARLAYFPSGESTVTLVGTTVNGYVLSYALYCSGGQTMTVKLDLPSSTAYLDVFGVATGVLLSPADKETYWSGTLPSTQPYVIEIIPSGGNVVNFSVTVTVH
jgi:hypothetical protein